MIKRWRRNPPATALERSRTKALGSVLWEGGTYLASVTYSDGKHSVPKGWYWRAPFIAKRGIAYKDSEREPVSSEKEAKEAAMAYVRSCEKEFYARK